MVDYEKEPELHVRVSKEYLDMLENRMRCRIMSIKNKNNIHYVEDDNKYACIKAVDITFVKGTRDWKKVTCKNCLKHRIINHNNKVKGKKCQK